MFKIMKYLKKSIIPILFIIILLFLQANADLALPDYTSKIVNIGVQQSGIESVVPKVIREDIMKKVVVLLDDNDKTTLLNSYNLINYNTLSNKEKKGYKDKYPNIDKISLYELKDIDKITKDSISKFIGKPLMIVGGLVSNNEQSLKMKQNIISKISKNIPIDENMDIFEVVSMLPKEQRQLIMFEINKNIGGLPENIVNQAAIAFVKQEYEVIGINVGGMQTNYILIAGAKMLLIALGSMIASVTVGLLGAKVAAKVAKLLRGKIFEKVVRFSKSEFKNFSIASLITRSTNDIQQIQIAVVMMLRIVIYAPILGFGGLIKVLNTNNSMAWIIGLAVSTILVVILFLFIVAIPKFKLIQKLIDKLNLVSREILTGLPVIRAFSTEKHEEKRFDNANVDLTKVSLFVNRVMSIMMPLMMFIMNAIAILIVWNGAHSIDNGTMQVGDMMAFIQYTMQIIMAFLMISMFSIMIPRASVSMSRVEEVLNTKNTIEDPINPKKFDTTKKGLVEFKNVTFRYPDADADILTDINFAALPGKTTAFIGSTGSGKSTLVNLIPRFFDVTQGEILVDGVNVKDVKEHDLHAVIGYVPQKGVLFSGTIASNIKYGNHELTEEEVKKVASIAQASDFIEAKEGQYESPIAQGGTNVSGGQKQRLSIARAVAINPEIYIFDDSFSALDFKTDVALRKALKKETKNSTVLIVAQRISTIMHADQIVVLDEGKIVGIGNHHDLLETCKVYKEIAASQLSKEELANE